MLYSRLAKYGENYIFDQGLGKFWNFQFMVCRRGFWLEMGGRTMDKNKENAKFTQLQTTPGLLSVDVSSATRDKSYRPSQIVHAPSTCFVTQLQFNQRRAVTLSLKMVFNFENFETKILYKHRLYDILFS